MVRQLRIEFEGAYYHILSRGNNQSNIFHSDEDRQDFLYILADMSERFEVEIYAYVLMDNHYHLLLRSGGRSLVYKFLPLLDRSGGRSLVYKFLFF